MEFSQTPQKRNRLDEKLKQRVRATFRATGKVMGSQIIQQVALQVIGNDTARAGRSQPHRLSVGGVSTDYRPRPGAASTAVAEDLAPLPPVAASTSPSLRSATDPPPHSSRGQRGWNNQTRTPQSPRVPSQTLHPLSAIRSVEELDNIRRGD